MSNTETIKAYLVKSIIPVLILASGFAGFLFLSNLKKTPRKSPKKSKPPIAQTIVVESHEKLDIEVDGMVLPSRQIKLSAEIEGRVKYKAADCQEGKYVTGGTTLIEIDSRDYKSEVDRLEALLDQADKQLEEIAAEIESAEELKHLSGLETAIRKRELIRAQDLVRQGATTESEIDTVTFNLVTSRISEQKAVTNHRLLEVREKRLEGAKRVVIAQLDRAQNDFERTKISAPISGVIVSDLVEEDEYVQKGTLLFQMADISTVEVKCNLRMEDLYWIWQTARSTGGMSEDERRKLAYEIPSQTAVTVIYRGKDGRESQWKGVLSRYDGFGLDAQTRTMPCRVVVNDPLRIEAKGSASENRPNDLPALFGNLFVTVRIHTEPRVKLLRIPERAVRPGNIVWKLSDGKLHIQRVQIAGHVDGNVILRADTSGLAAGDKIVVSPIAAVSEGMDIREKDSE